MNVLMERDGIQEEEINEAKLEHLLSEKLMEGYVLLETSCPVCSTPLVKNHHMVPKNLSTSGEFDIGTFAKNVLLPNKSFEQPFRPVEGVPICVSCKSHVITQETEVCILEQCDSLKDKGSIYVALKDVQEGHFYSDENDQTEANFFPPEIIHLENMKEEKFINSRHLDVNIHAVDCVDNDENSAFEVVSSPRFDRMEAQDQPSHPEPIFVEDPAYLKNRPPRPPQQSENITEKRDDNEQDAEGGGKTSETMEKTDVVDVMEEYSVRREIATKVLGAKMLQGYTLKETTCDTCGMPVMDFKGKVDCVVCPVLAKKAKKKLKASKKLEEEKVRLERKVQEKKELEKKMKDKRLEKERIETECIERERQRQDAERLELERIDMEHQQQINRLEKEREHQEEERVELERRIKQERLEKERIELESIASEKYERLAKARLEREELEHIKQREEESMRECLVKARLDREELERIEQIRTELEEKRNSEEEEEEQRAEEKRRELEEERVHILGLEKEEMQRIMELEEEEFRLLEDARERALALVEQEERTELTRLEAIAMEEKEMRRTLEVQREKEERLATREAEQKARQEAEEKTLLDEKKKLEAFDENTVSDKTEVTKQDLMVEEHRKRLAGKAALDEDVAKLEEERYREEMELRRIAEDRRATSEDRMIAALEADAAVKALAAEAAIRRAKDALDSITSTKKEIIAQTIAMAEIEAVAETEKATKAQCEDYKEMIILPSESELFKERWDTLRMESRSIMTRRILQGWELLPEGCGGAECHLSPLVSKLGQKECVVCGGTGSGCDGVYTDEDAKSENSTVIHLNTLPNTTTKCDKVEDDVLTYGDQIGKQDDFEEKRNIAGKEIGSRMLMGWTLIDASCPDCVMPLMMDDLGNSNICVLCNEMEQQFDASTIATKEMMMTTLEDYTNVVDAEEDLEGVTDEEVVDEATEIVDADDVKDIEDATEEDSTVAETLEEADEDPSESVVYLPHAPSQPLIINVESDLCSYIQEASKKNNISFPRSVRSDPPECTNLPTSPGAIDAPPSFTVDEQYHEEWEVKGEEVCGKSNESDVKDTSKKHDGAKKDTSVDEVITLPNNVDFADVCDKSVESDNKDASDKHGDVENDTSADEVITLPNNVDFADAATMRRLVEENEEEEEEEEIEEEKRANTIVEEYEEEEEEVEEEKLGKDNSNVENSVDISTEMIVNMFLRSPHGYDFYDSGAKMSLEDVKERVDIFVVTNMDSDISDGFKFKIARRILDKVLDQHFDVIHLEDMSSSPPPPPPPSSYTQPPPAPVRTYQQQSTFHFDEGVSVTKSVRSNGIQRRRPCPEEIPRRTSSSQRLPPKSPSSSHRGSSNSTGRSKTVIVGGPLAGGNRHHQRNNAHQPNDDEYSAGGASRASTVASLALETIYERIDACKQKLLDPSNNIDEQIATASLLEKLATAAVAVKEMEQLE